ncbi:GNAT family N-acetyltransferase [Lactiplantibacillus fabifermentans]|uniref:Acetyltransferase n=2 Tax=Lactiplantibacillus fabifermentans TaxID=483011 RepID=A0A0R2NQ12_9LACO|nr:GNAT family N-acetyltransferase [Lactiplantibacillus fabifermentans]ETY74042.1 GCN5 family N-acetyltransferase [Lactiplantibacillus fabifermentans T30PCM01]KRO26811.1 acetyltransferase [Lactiplantibacillus fabifermentans DSM 21115]
MEFKTYHFDELTPRQIQAMYKLRVAIFVVEQNCPYQEVDDTDLTALHLFGTDAEGQLVAYARLMQEHGNQARFGRVIVSEAARGHGSGQRLVQTAIDQIQKLWPDTTQINIQGQFYLDKFYRSFGLVPVSDVYLEDGIPHQDMVLKLTPSQTK